MNTIDVIYDGRTFVPSGPVDVPPGTRATLSLPDHGYPGPRAGAPDPDHPPTPEEVAIWIEMMRSVRTTPPDPPTFEEYLRQQRGEP
jgi:hypothetical protein